MTQGITTGGKKIRCDICGKPIEKTRPNNKRCTGRKGLSECQKAAEMIAAEMRKDIISEQRKYRRKTHVKIFRDDDGGTDRASRQCLKCGRKFKSRDRFNRICRGCGALNEQVSYHVHRRLIPN